MSSHVRLDLSPFVWTARPLQEDAPPPPQDPIIWKGLGADSEEKREPVSDIDTAAADSLKVLDPERPIREADISSPRRSYFRPRGAAPAALGVLWSLRTSNAATIKEAAFAE